MYCGVPRLQSRLRHAMPARLLHGQRDSEVGHRRVAALQQNVFGLDVAVNHAQLVRVAERVGDLARDSNRVVCRQLLLTREARAQRLPGDERHHVEQQSIGAARVEQRKDVRMLEPARSF